MQWFYLWLSFFSLFAFGLADSSRGPVFPDLLRDFGLSDTKGALFFFVTSLFSLGNNFLSTYWLPRWGAFRSVRIYLAVQCLGLVVMGLAPDYVWLLVGSALFGVGMGGLGIAQNTLVGRSSEGHGRRRAYSFLHCMYGAASLVAPMAVSVLYSAGYKWQNVLLFMAVPSAFCWAVAFTRKAPVGDSGGATERARLGDAKKAVIPLAIALGVYVMSELLVSTRIVLLARREYGMDVVAANDRLTLFFALLFVGRMIFVFAPPHWASLTIVRVSAVLSTVTFAVGLLLGPGWLALTGLTMAPFFPAAMSHIQEKFGMAGSAAMSWVFTFSSLLTMLMHQGVGVATDAFGLKTAMWIGPLALFVTLFVLFFGSSKTPSKTGSFS